MPPFGDEPGEKISRPLNFLSFRHAVPKRRPGSVSNVFGPESAEPDPEEAGSAGLHQTGTSSRTKLTKRPFEDEEDETGFQKQRPKVKGGSTLPLSVFGDEGSEDESGAPVKGKCASKPFGEEDGETDDQSSPPSSNDEKAFLVKHNTVFSFGWGSVSSFKKATFWREKMDDEKAKKPKRQYDNRKRSATAVYARKNSHGVFQRNGTDPARLQKLFDAPCCSCDFG